MSLTLGKIAEMIGATLDGDPAMEITGVCGIEDAGPGEVTFVANPKYLPAVSQTRASAIIAAPEIELDSDRPLAALRTPEPYLAFTQLLQHFASQFAHHSDRHPTAMIAPTATVHESAAIHAGVVIEAGVTIEKNVVLYSGVCIGERSTIAEGSLLYPNVVIRPDVEIGARTILHNGVVLGAEGPPPPEAPSESSRIQPCVVLAEDVEIGSHTTVDGGFERPTTIGAGTKIDNLVHIGSEVNIGGGCLVVAQVGISAGAIIEDGVVLAGQTVVMPNIRIASGVTVAAQSSVVEDLLSPGTYVGAPARRHRSFLSMVVTRQKLPELRRTVAELDRRIAAIEEHREDA